MKTMKKVLINFIKINFFCLFSFFFLATYPLVIVAEEQSQFTEIARERQYAGGHDESDLKVQQKAVSNSKAKPADRQESDEGF